MFPKDKLINYLKSKQKSSFIDIVKFLKINPRENRDFSKFLEDLKNRGEISFSKKYNKFFIPKYVGNFDIDYKPSLRGAGFCFINLEEKDVKVIIFSNSLNALKDDNINIDVFLDEDDNFYFANQLKINKRKNKIIYAQIDQDLNLIPINFNNMQVDFFYDKSLLKPNTYVKFKIDKVEKDVIFLSIDETLYQVNEPYSDISLLVDISNVEKNFPHDVIEEAKKIPDEVTDVNKFNRIDLTKKMIVTIDGEKTKDFDDAISVEKTNDHEYTLGVHIADVAYYVKEDSKLDLEARKRGTSIYLIDKVIPMLPEKLSNGICSLNPNVKRFTLTLEARINHLGNVISKKIYPSLIESKYRLTYNQVHNMKNEELITNNKELEKMLLHAYELSDIISKNKSNQGYIDFEIEEPIIELDKETGRAISIKKRERLSSEILIENFMVFANETVSKLISDLHIPSIYRVHEPPSSEKIQALKGFVKTLGIDDHNLRETTDPKIFQNFVNELKGGRFDNLIKMSLLRTMQKAKYSSNNIGHFGLASKYYSHFTSPIRRYPDLLLHRIIWEVIFKNNKEYSIDKANLIESIAHQSSTLEVNAVDLERKVNDMKKAEFYETLIGLIRDATIISIHKFGFFVDFEDSTNALVHISTLTETNDYEVSDDLCKLFLKDKKEVYVVGQKLKVKIISTSKLEGKISAILA